MSRWSLANVSREEGWHIPYLSQQFTSTSLRDPNFYSKLQIDYNELWSKQYLIW